jgi:uncharacterized membrane protein YeaQ/YmgE (transglycosylase-associated protein family)
MNLTIAQVIVWLIVGAIAGGLAGMLLRGHSLGRAMDIFIGLLGALVGGVIFSLLHITQLNFLDQIKVSLLDIVVAFVGAVVILLIASLINRRRI